MPIRPFLLLARLAKGVGYGYRARSVEAIRLSKALEQELVGLPQPNYERFGVNHFAAPS
jgi:hypothetical protein